MKNMTDKQRREVALPSMRTEVKYIARALRFELDGTELVYDITVTRSPSGDLSHRAAHLGFDQEDEIIFFWKSGDYDSEGDASRAALEEMGLADLDDLAGEQVRDYDELCTDYIVEGLLASGTIEADYELYTAEAEPESYF